MGHQFRQCKPENVSSSEYNNLCCLVQNVILTNWDFGLFTQNDSYHQHKYMWQCWSCSAAGYRRSPSSLFTLLDPVCDPVLWQFLWQTWIFFWVKFIELNRFTRTETSPHNWCVGQRMQGTVQWCWQWIHNELDAEKQTWKTSLYSNWARVYRHLHARSPCPNGLLMFLMVQNCW